MELDGLRTLIRYASCSVGIVAATTGVGLVASLVACMLLFYPDN